MAKVKCNFQPRCLRCTNKGLECVYDTTAANASIHAPTTSEEQITNEQPAANASPVFTLDLFAIGDINSTFNDFGASTETIDMDEAQVYVDWDEVNLVESPETDILSQSPMNNLPCFQYEQAARPNRQPAHKENLLLTDLPWSALGPPDNSLPVMSETTCLSELPYREFLTPIPIPNPVAKFTGNIVMQMLCAFPQMMLRRETLPPFIHGHWYQTTSAIEPALPRPLVNCMGLAQVFASHNLETRLFLWHTGRAEQHSLAEKASQCQFSKDEHLAAIQALLVYIMMRVIDNSKIEPDLNLELLVTYQSLCDSFKAGKIGFLPSPEEGNVQCHFSTHTPIHILMFTNNLNRRTAIVWLLITQMFQIKIGVPCDRFESFRDIPLSSPKSLWEARTRAAWQSEYEVYATMPRMGLDVFGDLLDACKQGDVGLNKLKLHAWNATVDNLGILLNLCAEMT
ncbi:hypothetical protein UA08_00398 [Talaromyces atroroseus]|uniref:Zn(2)-C6 fungal-type domain-containing protein n=1 Tax=Talaromyces atroroseus TaxID=1441469 RepID=A0A225B0L6_TALAT|nr:hypothetical protein UA08_00398 [Talaromyces atroroseus]OKL64254.1 hypothetical protein UA08_00398 [Talaromyces atroroseus]